MPEITEDTIAEVAEATEVVKEIPDNTTAPEEPIEPFRYTPENVEDAVHPLTVLHEATEAAQNSYNDTVANAKQIQDEAVASAKKQYEQSVKEYNAAIEAASRK